MLICRVRFGLHAVVCRSCAFATHDGALCVDRRDDEIGYVSVNGKECWKQTFWGSLGGSNQCGGDQGQTAANEASVAVVCEAEAVSGKLTVRTYSSVNQGPHDESFAIDNVVIDKISADTGAMHLFALGPKPKPTRSVARFQGYNAAYPH